VTALWTVAVLASTLAVIESAAVIGLIRQVGLLHLRMEAPRQPQLSPGQQPPRGLQPGSRLRLDPLRDVLADAPAPDLVLFGFVRPTCTSCTVALPAFTSAASQLSVNERVLLMSDSDEALTRAYLAAHGVSLPLVTGPHLLSANGIPTIPYAVVADGSGNVLASGAATSAEQLGAVLSRARQGMQPVTRRAATARDGALGDERQHALRKEGRCHSTASWRLPPDGWPADRPAGRS
jgi:hypothetical protein